jgi:asparagine synthase (glutamine-hydrolysing)
MAGIALAVGDGAEQAARRGLEPLRRRSWHVPRLWTSSRAAVGFCGEHGGLAGEGDRAVVAVDGELVLDDGIVDGDDAAAHLLRLYRREGPRLRPPPGQYAAALWDEETATLVLVTHSLGARPLYLARQDGLTLVASELKALVLAGLRPRLDLDGAAQLLAYEQLLGERTLLAGVRQLPPGHTTVLDAAGERCLGDGRYRVAPAHEANGDEAVATFGRLLDQAVRLRYEPGTALALSGGLDSRCLATIVGRHWAGARAFTFGARGSEEVKRAAAVGRLAGLEHVLLELEPGYVARGVEETVWLSEGHIRGLHAHHLALQRVRSEHGATALLAGYAGDAVARTHPLVAAAAAARGHPALARTVHDRMAVAVDDRRHEQALTRAFAGELRGRARDALAGVLADLEGPPTHRILDFLGLQVYRRKILPGIELFADDVVHRDPYLDDELLAFLARVPLGLRHSLQLEYLRTYPELARIPNPKSGMPPALRGHRLLAARLRVRLQRTARSRADRLLRRLGRPPRTGYSDYTSHLRGDDGRQVLGILLDERTLSRGQIRAETVRELVAETVAGRAAHTQVLGVLLTLELFQRQFVDGDGLGPVRFGHAGEEPRG